VCILERERERGVCSRALVAVYLYDRVSDRLRYCLTGFRKPVSPPYWAIQAGLLTPLTFARHRLSPLAVFTSGAYFLHSKFANFTLPTLKAFLDACSHTVSGNK